MNTKPGAMVVVRDEVADRLDEIADLCEVWKRWREQRNHTPDAVRAGLIQAARVLIEAEDANRSSLENIIRSMCIDQTGSGQ